MDELNDDDRRILAFEHGRWWKYAGAKESAILAEFGVSATRYYQRLNVLIDRPEAMAYDAVTVKRLQRLRAGRRRSRSSDRVALQAGVR